MGAGSSAIDNILEDSDTFQNAVVEAWDSAAESTLPADKVLSALQAVFVVVSASLPPPGRKLITRCPTPSDLFAVKPDAEPLDFDAFEAVARAVFRRISVDRGRRVLLAVVVGCVLVKSFKLSCRRTPLLGPLLAAVVVPALPTTPVSGPALGLAVCAYWPESKTLPTRLTPERLRRTPR